MQLKTVGEEPGLTMRATNGESMGRGVVEMLTLGHVSFGRTYFHTMPAAFMEKTTDGASGCIGMNALVGADYELDLAHNKLDIFKMNRCVTGGVAYWTDTFTSVPYELDQHGDLTFPMEMDGKKITASPQINKTWTSLRTDISKKIDDFDETSPGITMEDMGDYTPTGRFRAMRMSAKGLSINNSEVLLLPGIGKGCRVTPTGGAGRSASYDNCSGSPPLLIACFEDVV